MDDVVAVVVDVVVVVGVADDGLGLRVPAGGEGLGGRLHSRGPAASPPLVRAAVQAEGAVVALRVAGREGSETEPNRSDATTVRKRHKPSRGMLPYNRNR